MTLLAHQRVANLTMVSKVPMPKVLLHLAHRSQARPWLVDWAERPCCDSTGRRAEASGVTASHHWHTGWGRRHKGYATRGWRPGTTRHHIAASKHKGSGTQGGTTQAKCALMAAWPPLSWPPLLWPAALVPSSPSVRLCNNLLSAVCPLQVHCAQKFELASLLRARCFSQRYTMDRAVRTPGAQQEDGYVMRVGGWLRPLGKLVVLGSYLLAPSKAVSNY